MISLDRSKKRKKIKNFFILQVSGNQFFRKRNKVFLPFSFLLNSVIPMNVGNVEKTYTMYFIHF